MSDATQEVPLDPDLVPANRALRDFLEVARSWGGAAPTRLLGREPGRVTTYRYDEYGHLVESVTTREPEWTDLDRRLVMALHAYEADLCPGCRHPLAETTDPAAEERFVPGGSIRCHRCTAASMAADLTRGNPHPGALLHTVKTRPPVPPDDDDPTPAEEDP